MVVEASAVCTELIFSSACINVGRVTKPHAANPNVHLFTLIQCSSCDRFNYVQCVEQANPVCPFRTQVNKFFSGTSRISFMGRDGLFGLVAWTTTHVPKSL